MENFKEGVFMQEFQKFARGKSAQTAHQAILASIQTMDQARQNAVLWFAEIKKRKLYRDLGYPSMNMYATRALGFSSSRASEFSRLADKLEGLPRLRSALEDGTIGYTKASQVARVSNRENEGQWLAEAHQCSRRELDMKIKRARSKAAAEMKGQPELLMPVPKKENPLPAAVVPVRLTIEFDPEQFARYEALLEKIRKTRHQLPADGAAAMLALLGAYLEHSHRRESWHSDAAAGQGPACDTAPGQLAGPVAGPVAPPPFQIHLHRCPDCARTTVQTGRGEMPVTDATVQRAECDAQLARPGKRNTATIPPGTRRQVLGRDRHQCRRPGCGNTRFLEVHHIVPRARGGGNDMENLVTLCAACHQLVHEKKWELVRENSPPYGSVVAKRSGDWAARFPWQDGDISQARARPAPPLTDRPGFR
jgi:hypothetical protein